MIGLLQFFQRGHQHFRDESPAVGSKVPCAIGLRGSSIVMISLLFKAALAVRRRLHKVPHFSVILHAGRCFQPRARVDTPGTRYADGLGDVRCVQAAGENRSLPLELLALLRAPASNRRYARSPRPSSKHGFAVRSRTPHRGHSDMRNAFQAGRVRAGGARRRKFAPHPGRRAHHGRDHCAAGSSTKMPIFHARNPSPSFGGASGATKRGLFGIENKSQRIGPGVHRRDRVFDVA